MYIIEEEYNSIEKPTYFRNWKPLFSYMTLFLSMIAFRGLLFGVNENKFEHTMFTLYRFTLYNDYKCPNERYYTLYAIHILVQ